MKKIIFFLVMGCVVWSGGHAAQPPQNLINQDLEAVLKNYDLSWPDVKKREHVFDNALTPLGRDQLKSHFDATRREIYKSLSKIYHPDKNSAENRKKCEDVFKIVTTLFQSTKEEDKEILRGLVKASSKSSFYNPPANAQGNAAQSAKDLSEENQLEEIERELERRNKEEEERRKAEKAATAKQFADLEKELKNMPGYQQFSSFSFTGTLTPKEIREQGRTIAENLRQKNEERFSGDLDLKLANNKERKREELDEEYETKVEEINSSNLSDNKKTEKKINLLKILMINSQKIHDQLMTDLKKSPEEKIKILNDANAGRSYIPTSYPSTFSSAAHLRQALQLLKLKLLQLAQKLSTKKA